MSRGVLTPRIDAPINWVDPVNWLHPLTHGLQSLWLCSAGTTGGLRMQDMCRRNPGTLTSMNPQTVWSGDAPRNNSGCINAEGVSAGEVRAPLTQAVSTTSAFTIGVWVKVTAAAIIYASATTYNRRYGLLLMDDGAGTGVYIGSHPSTTGLTTLTAQIAWNGGAYLSTTSGAVTTDTWHLLTATHTGSALTIFLDDRGPGTTGSGSPTAVNLTAMNINGRCQQGFNVYGNGRGQARYAGAFLYSHVLTRSEIDRLYLDGLQGYPGLLNRVQLPFALQAAASSVAGRLIGGRLVGGHLTRSRLVGI